MPTSSAEGKGWLMRRIEALAPATVLDVGAGEGTYATLLRPLLPHATFIGVEVWQPYVARYDLTVLYDEVIVGDARQVALPAVDVVILGDVLEHMTRLDAEVLWARARGVARLGVFASIPVIECPQGAVNGNVYETHRATWTHELGQALPGVVDSWVGLEIGCYQASP